MKKLVLAIALAAVSTSAFAHGHRGGGYWRCHHGWHYSYHHNYHGGYWGPSVVQQPVVQRQPVWVEGRYVDQVQANGSTVRIW